MYWRSGGTAPRFVIFGQEMLRHVAHSGCSSVFGLTNGEHCVLVSARCSFTCRVKRLVRRDRCWFTVELFPNSFLFAAQCIKYVSADINYWSGYQSLTVFKPDLSLSLSHGESVTWGVESRKSLVLWFSPKYVLKLYSSLYKSRDSSVGIALGYGLNDRGSRVRFPVRAGNFSLHHRVQNGSGAHPASYPMGNRGSSLRVKRPVCEADHSPPSSAEGKEWVELYIHSPNMPSWRGA
jgi:hypothetical protein